MYTTHRISTGHRCNPELTRACSAVRVEPLENRQLLAAAELDETFGGGDGVVETRGSIIAVAPDEKIVVAGSSGGTPTISRYLPSGAADTSFGGGDGSIDTDFFNLFDVEVQADGKIVAVGEDHLHRFRVARYTSGGQLDTSFSGDGIYTKTFGGDRGNDFASAVAIQEDGRIVVVGAGTTARSPSERSLVIVRLNPNGSIDTTFDNDGYSAEDLSVAHEWANAVTIADDGKIIVGGVSGMSGLVIRYNANGSFDRTFDGDGIAYPPLLLVNALDTQPDGKVLFAGIRRESMADFGDIVGRLTTAGTADPTFGGGDGVVEDLFEVLEGYGSDATSMLLQPGGKILVGGGNEDRSTDDREATLTRLNADGSVDTEFTGGARYMKVPFTTDGTFGIVQELALHGEDGVLVGGRGSNRTMMARYVTEETDPDPDPETGDGLTSTYYSNLDFTGNTLSRVDQEIFFQWGQGGPSSAIGFDTFSVRWTGRVEAEKTERYTFHTRTDDGVRLWVNGQLIIDKWVPQSETEWTGSIDLVAGQKYDIRLEYFERFGNATAQLYWSSPTTPRQLVPTENLFSDASVPVDDQPPTAPPQVFVVANTVEQVYIGWDAATDNLAVTEYQIYRDGRRIGTVPAHQLEFADQDVEPETTYGYAVFAFDAARNGSPATTITVTTPDQPGPPGTQGLWAFYYDNMDFTDLEGQEIVQNLDFDWGYASPRNGIDADTFSVRYDGHVVADKTERYTFYTRSDDGVRLWVNGRLLIDQLVPQSLTEHSGVIELEAGKAYDIRLDYFERFGQASVELLWSSPTTAKQIIPGSNFRATPGGTADV